MELNQSIAISFINSDGFLTLSFRCLYLFRVLSDLISAGCIWTLLIIVCFSTSRICTLNIRQQQVNRTCSVIEKPRLTIVLCFSFINIRLTSSINRSISTLIRPLRFRNYDVIRNYVSFISCILFYHAMCYDFMTLSLLS